MSQSTPNARRRSFQFGLGRLLASMTIMAVGFAIMLWASSLMATPAKFIDAEFRCLVGFLASGVAIAESAGILVRRQRLAAVIGFVTGALAFAFIVLAESV